LLASKGRNTDSNYLTKKHFTPKPLLLCGLACGAQGASFLKLYDCVIWGAGFILLAQKNINFI
jgi:hypothetical protein